MSERFWVDGVEYLADGLSEDGQGLLKLMRFAQLRLQELSNQQILMNKAKNAYIADLKIEIVEGRSGLDLGALFADD
jgi:hypothetical protein